MRITIATYGTRGDVQPFIALALGLQKAGHLVCIAAPARFEGLVTQYGVSFAPLPGDPEQLIVHINNLRHNPLRAAWSLARHGYATAPGVIRAVADACSGADLIIHFFFLTSVAHSLARASGIPDVAVQVFPFFAPTRTFPMIGFPNLPRGALSYASHWLTTQAFRHVLDGGLRLLRLRTPDFFAPPLRWPFDASARVATPLLFAFSPTVVPGPADWTTPNIHITGYFFLDAPATYQPPQDLLDFLAAGDAPLCVTFGSMVNRDLAQVSRTVRTALAQTKQRGVFLTGWGGSEPDEHDDRFFYIDGAPHDWLFPLCSAVVHHGGAGTAAAALRAGIPNVIVPNTLDQMFWGRCIAACGGGAPPIALRDLSVAALTSALAQAHDPALRARTLETSLLIRAEDGVATAVRLIEEHAAAFARGTG